MGLGSNGNGNVNVDVGVTRLNGVDEMCRSRGIVDLSFCGNGNGNGSDNNDSNSSGTFRFCALRTNGSLEQWEGFAPNQSKNDKLCGGTYKNVHTVRNIFQTMEKQKGQEDKEDKENSSSSSSSTMSMGIGRPIAMCTALQYQNFTNGSNLHRSNIVACCSSAGVVSLLDSNRMDEGVRAQYNIYSKSNSNGNSNSNANANAKLSYIKGNFTNRDIATAMAMDHEAKRIVVGGRERAATMMDVETGEKIWKVRGGKTSTLLLSL